MAEYNARTQEWSGLTNYVDTVGSAITTTTAGTTYPINYTYWNVQPVTFYNNSNLTWTVGTADEAEKEKMKMKDTKKFKYALYEESRGFVGIYEDENEATRIAEKGLADNKSALYTIFRAAVQIAGEPVKTVKTEIK